MAKKKLTTEKIAQIASLRHKKVVRKSILIIFSSMFGLSKIFATPQIPDFIIYNKDTLLLLAYPLQSYQPNENFASPKNLFNIEDCFSTGCWRGYIATWEIINNKLYLTQIRNHCYRFIDSTRNFGSEYADLKALFPKKYKNGKVFADWVTRKIYAPFGKQLLSGYDVFDSVYEYEYEFNIENGIVKKVTKYHNKQVTSSVFSGKWDDTDDEFLAQVDTLDKYIKSRINWERLPALSKDTVIKVEVFFEANETGIIDTVELLSNKTPNVFEKEVIRVIKPVPWGSYIVRGKVRGMRGHYRIDFSVPIDSQEERELNKRDSLIRHYTEEQKIKIIKERENITDSIKVLFYKEFRKEGTRKYEFLYMFINYTLGNKYLNETFERNEDILQLFPHNLDNKKANENTKMKHFSSSCWFPLTFYDGFFYNYRGDDGVCILTDSVVHKYMFSNWTMPVKNFEIIDSTHFRITHDFRGENHSLDIYFHDERYAVFKFSQWLYPQLYVNSEGIKYIPIITHTCWSRDDDFPNALWNIEYARDILPEDGETFFKSLRLGK